MCVQGLGEIVVKGETCTYMYTQQSLSLGDKITNTCRASTYKSQFSVDNSYMHICTNML